MTGDARNLALWDALELKPGDYCSVADMTVSRVSTKEVTEFCRRWHYANYGGNMLWRYGLWDDAYLVGICTFNLPTREACACVFGDDKWDWVVHMGRLACAENTPRNVESRLIAGAMRLLKEDRPVVRAVLTYASTDQEHVGYVYQATNALYTGLTSSQEYSVDFDGNRYSTRNMKTPMARARGWEISKDGGKHRYVYLIGTRTERREARTLLLLPVLPYPKAERETA